MNFIKTGTLIFIKRLLSSKGYIISMLILPFAIFLLSLIIPKDEHNNINIGISYDSNSIISRDIINILYQGENFNYYYYINIDEMKKNIASNKLHVGYIINNDIDIKVSDRDYKNLITKVSSQASYLSPIIDETICSSTIQALSPYIGDSFLYERVIIEYDENAKSYLVNRVSDYLSKGDIFTYKLFSNNKSIDKSSNLFNINLLTFVCLSLSISILVGSLLITIFNSNNNKKLYVLFKSSGASIFNIKFCFILSLLISNLFFTLLSILVLSILLNIQYFSIFSLTVIFISYSIFVGGLCSIIENYNYACRLMLLLIPFIVFGNFLFSGFLISSNILNNIFNKISYIFPSKYFISGLYDLNSQVLTFESLINPFLLIIVGILLFTISISTFYKN